jgi:RNA polymerase sigma factor (sigma-70 family)
MLPGVAMNDRIHRHHADLVGFLTRRAPEAGEELAQEVWLRVARAQPHCETDGHFLAYAYTVARRLLIDHYRRRASRVQLVSLDGGLEQGGGRSLEQLAGPDASSPDANASAADVLSVVEQALADMKPAMAEVFRLRTTQDITFREIAERQGVSVNTALGRMHQATLKVRAALSAHDLLPSGGSR